MGLGMITAIRQFDEDRNESVNMRVRQFMPISLQFLPNDKIEKRNHGLYVPYNVQVGIHTGKVLCGIVGKRRFKFDVWSNDVTFANKMESSGKPGMVHISEKTYAFLKDQYFVLEGEDVQGKNKLLFDQHFLSNIL